MAEPEPLEQTFHKAVRLAPDSADLFGLLGGALEKAGRADDALMAFGKAVALDPGLAVAHYNLGNALKELGRSEDVADCYRRAVAADPGFAAAASMPIAGPGNLAAFKDRRGDRGNGE